MASDHVHECEYEKHRGKEDLGCFCDCGAVRHIMGWQKAKGIGETEEPKAPCAVVIEEPVFDIEEYRADLLRRIASLEEMADRVASTIAHTRLTHKAAGLQIALDLLPKEET